MERAIYFYRLFFLFSCLISLNACTWPPHSDEPTYISNANGTYIYYPEGAYYYAEYPNTAVVIGRANYPWSYPYYVPTCGKFKVNNRCYRIYKSPHLPKWPCPCAHKCTHVKHSYRTCGRS